MTVLAHACCGICAIGCLRHLTELGHDASAYFYNPNIHPLLEFRRRLKAVRLLSDRLGSREPAFADAAYEQDYGLERFLREVYVDGKAGRCERCYERRLTETARKARERGCERFTTTLLISPHQHHETVRRIGEEVGERERVPFLYVDFRPHFEASRSEAKTLGLYSQSYCGCLFSEYERYRHTTKHLYRGPEPRAKPSG